MTHIYMLGQIIFVSSSHTVVKFIEYMKYIKIYVKLHLALENYIFNYGELCLLPEKEYMCMVYDFH